MWLAMGGRGEVVPAAGMAGGVVGENLGRPNTKDQCRGRRAALGRLWLADDGVGPVAGAAESSSSCERLGEGVRRNGRVRSVAGIWDQGSGVEKRRRVWRLG